MAFKIKEEFHDLRDKVKSLDRTAVIILISITVLQTVSFYYTSRRFFRFEIRHLFVDDPNVNLYEFSYWMIGDFFVYFVLALLIGVFLLKKKPSDFGLRIGEWKIGLPAVLIFLLFMLPLIWMVSSTAEFTAKYPHLYEAKGSWELFFIYEAGMLLYMFGWEFIWRGFTLFGLFEKFGYYAILIQVIPFVILHNGKPALETFGAILGGIALGILALRTRSFIYCFLTHFGVMFMIDTISALRYRAGDYGTSFNSMINVLQELWR